MKSLTLFFAGLLLIATAVGSEPPSVNEVATARQTTQHADEAISHDNIDLTGAAKLLQWDFGNPGDVAKWNERKRVDVTMRDGRTRLVATAADAQIATTLDQPLSGSLVIELRAQPMTDTTIQFFWASPGRGFNGNQQIRRRLPASQAVNTYLYKIDERGPIEKIRFDPFATYNKDTDVGSMLIESIAVYALPSAESSATPMANKSASNRPNILFILSEDQGAHLGFLGTPGLQTPHIDAIARSGVYFNDAFVAYPVCSASKAAIYTGLYGHTNGVLNNTYNFHMPASKVSPAQRAMPLSKTNFIRDPYLTLTQILRANGYYQGVTHKLHVLPNDKFPYDEFLHGSRTETQGFLKRAQAKGQPWFLMVNIPYSHRPYPNSDKQAIRPKPADVELPPCLPDTPVIRKDWAEYLAGIEEVDGAVGETMDLLRQSGQQDNTIVVYMSDHGPTYPHGKMTLYDLGLRVPLIFSGSGIPSGVRTDALASGVDLLPTLMDLIVRHSGDQLKIPGSNQSELPYELQGVSLADVVAGKPDSSGREFVFAEISDRGPLPNDGMQERSVFDGRWKLIYREKVDSAWRQVNADSREFKVWGNRTYVETIRLKDKFPKQYQILAEMDPQNLGGAVPELELYDLKSDPDEMNNLADSPEHDGKRKQLLAALHQWVIDTKDSSISPAASPSPLEY